MTEQVYKTIYLDLLYGQEQKPWKDALLQSCKIH